MKNIEDLAAEIDSLSDEEKATKIAAGKAKLQAKLGFSDEKMSGYVASIDHTFEALAILTQEGLLLPEQGLAFIAVLADVGMGRGSSDTAEETVLP